MSSICAEDGCDRLVEIHSRSLCRRCYGEHHRAGTLTPILCPVPDCANVHYRGGPCRSHRNEFATAGMNWCTYPECGNPLKAVTEFYSNGRQGLYAWCKPCDLLQRQKRERNRMAKNPGRKHGLTRDQYWKMFADQGGACAICQKDLDHKSRKSAYPNIDHDHMHCLGSYGCPKCIRSLLCNGCNILIGRAQDNTAILHRWEVTPKTPQSWLDAAIAYLEHWHAEMARRGIRPPIEDALWDDLFATITRLVTEIA